MKKIKKITILGTGNIANQYCDLFLKNKFEINCIYGNNEKNIDKKNLDKSIFTTNISKIPNDSDLYIAALSDDVYLKVLKGFNLENKFIVHSSGSLQSKTLEIATKTILVIIKKVAIIAVNLVRKFPAVLDDVKLSCETPNPKAPPSDLCSRIVTTRIMAKIMLIVIKILSIGSIYSNSLLYQ